MCIIKADKFGNRAKPYVFIGYPVGQKGYKVYDRETQRILITRDIVFYENRFPFILQDIEPKIVTEPTNMTQHVLENDQPVRSSSDVLDINNNSWDENNQEPQTGDNNEQQSDQNILPQRSQRTRKPSYLADYVVGFPQVGVTYSTLASHSSSGKVYDLAHHIAYTSFSTEHGAFFSSITKESEPATYEEANKMKGGSWLWKMN